MRLSSFFAGPVNSPPAPLCNTKTLKASPSPSKRQYMTKETAVRRSMSLERESPIPLLTKFTTVGLEKRRWLPHLKRERVTLAPDNRFLPSSKDDLAHLRDELDTYPTSTTKPTPSFPGKDHKTDRGYNVLPVRDILARIQGSSTNNPIDLTKESKQDAMEMLSSVPKKYLFFEQDVRPRYCGTWTKPVPEKEARRLAINPLHRRSEIDYDYDSEAEWDDEPGENLDSDGEGDESDDGEEDMEDFLDDDGAAKKSMISADLEPVSTGLLWPDTPEVPDLSEYEMGYLVGTYISQDYEQCFLEPTSSISLDIHKDTAKLQF
jgi:chromatin assembly factor 1 subunit A